jgi:hypothetical protein
VLEDTMCGSSIVRSRTKGHGVCLFVCLGTEEEPCSDMFGSLVIRYLLRDGLKCVHISKTV